VITVLLVEDDPMVAELNRRFVGCVEGFEAVGSAASAPEALAYLRGHHVDLVLLDIFMPGQNGLELLAKVRELAVDVDVICVTAAHDMSTIGKALQLGAVDYLIKPFEFDRLKQALQSYREARRARQEGRSVSQGELDRLMNRRPADARPAASLPKGLDRMTLARTWEALQQQEEWFVCEQVARRVGLSRVSVRKYLEFLCRVGILRMEPGYGTGGRPVHRFSIREERKEEIRRFL